MSLLEWLESLFTRKQPAATVIPIPLPKVNPVVPVAVPPKVTILDPYPAITALYKRAVVIKGLTELQRTAAKIKMYKSRYDTVADATGFPWFLIAGIHSLEASLDFGTYLQNGDPLFNSDGKPVKTVHVPAGVGPYPSWEIAAIEALGGKNAGVGKVWSIGYALYWAESYNGSGYRRRGIPSPYIWSYTDQYAKGKYVADGIFDPDAVSGQAGIAAIFKLLEI